LRPDAIGRLALAAPLGLWRDAAPIPDMFGFMSTRCAVPVCRYSCPPAQAMLALSQLVSTKDDRSEEQIETLIGLARGRGRRQVPLPASRDRLERRLWRITAPTLIIWGADDRFVAPLYAEIFREKIPDASS